MTCLYMYTFYIQKEFTIYVDKNGMIEDLLNESRKEVVRYLCVNTVLYCTIHVYNVLYVLHYTAA